ncbi:MAG: stage II sporulation protein M [Firmicutes bacterium]|nr:stage II sporulation protein M [Bacillota bacterium]
MRQGRRNGALAHLEENIGIYLFVTAVFTVGIIAGSLAVSLLTAEQLTELNQIFFNFLDYLTLDEPLNQTFILQRSLMQNGIFLLLIWFCGSIFFGFILILVGICYRGFTIGFTVGFLAQQGALRGILFSLAAILPQNLIYVPAIIVAGAVSVSSSLFLLRSRLHKKSPAAIFMRYSALIFIIALTFAVGSLIEAMVTPVCMRVMVSFL